jgi:hypothetical protein
MRKLSSGTVVLDCARWSDARGAEFKRSRIAADADSMVRLALQYPNGRTHYVELDAEIAKPKPGTEFELFGRQWRVIGHDRRRNSRHPKDALVCSSVARKAPV